MSNVIAVVLAGVFLYALWGIGRVMADLEFYRQAAHERGMSADRLQLERDQLAVVVLRLMKERDDYQQIAQQYDAILERTH